MQRSIRLVVCLVMAGTFAPALADTIPPGSDSAMTPTKARLDDDHVTMAPDVAGGESYGEPVEGTPARTAAADPVAAPSRQDPADPDERRADQRFLDEVWSAEP